MIHIPSVIRAETGALVTGLLQQRIAAMALEPGQRALDVGSGTGTSTLALADVVGASGEVRGVDYDVTMIIEAERRAVLDGVDAWVSFHQANAAALPWPDGYFDASCSDRVLQHMLDPIRAFEEFVRVTRSAGRIVVIDGDWATLTIDSGDPEIEGRLAYFRETLRPPSLRSGQCLQQLFQQQGMLEVRVDVYPVFEDNADLDWCWQQSRTPLSDAYGRFASANVVMVSGRKP